MCCWWSLPATPKEDWFRRQHTPSTLMIRSWALHSYPRAFNALTCGGVVPARMSAGGLAAEPEAPSPFTRVGPGFANSPKPDFCASAGNTNADYRPLAGTGVWGFSALSEALEGFGTSYAAPLLAREAAFVFEELRPKCPGDSRPFACAVKAVLALTADDIAKRLSEALQSFAKRTIGFGRGERREISSETNSTTSAFRLARRDRP